ncbi:TetR family transcriptional regulator [Polycladomyces abyssicola]|uniref:TetR family transcriptional regulator n=1 Tax=Polycladomyces abyssicola TaxID=1125966 RepID=A0A8D5UFF5_9BACL|nr:TetR/AcrR family transcriptional regulator [Polycladomyces abyssicola]BCU82481.1 TetR family transcriptional regulator [Polycladomyces abyssicola]
MSTKQRIQQVAIRLFAEHGYEGASLSMIAREVGIQKPSIYAFFESKEALFLSVFKEIMKAHFAHTQKLFASLQDKTVEERLYQLLTNGLTYASEHGDAFAFYQRAMLFSPPAVQEKIRDRFLEAETWLIDVLRDCFKEGIQTGVIRETNLDDLIASFLCLLDGVLIQLFYYGPEMLRRRIDGIWRIYWSGISH